MTSEHKKYFLDNPNNVALIIRLLVVVCIVLFGLDFVLERHEKYSLANIPGFYALYGFIGCVLLVIIAKWLRTFLMRPEDYYDKEIQRKNARGENVDS